MAADMGYLVIAFFFGLAGGIVGRMKGSSFWTWFLISGLIPFFGLLAAVCYRYEDRELRRQCPGCGRVVKLHDALCVTLRDRARVPRGGDRPRGRGSQPPRLADARLRPLIAAMPPPARRADPGNRFNAADMAQRLNVLFIVSQPTQVAGNLGARHARCGASTPIGSGSTWSTTGWAGHVSVARVCCLADRMSRSCPCEFGPSGDARPAPLSPRVLAAVAPAARDMLRLVSYVRRHRIDVLHCEHGVRECLLRSSCSLAWPAAAASSTSIRSTAAGCRRCPASGSVTRTPSSPSLPGPVR